MVIEEDQAEHVRQDALIFYDVFRTARAIVEGRDEDEFFALIKLFYLLVLFD